MPSLEEVEAVIRDGSYEGWCTNCKDWTHDCCEPDAHEYECPVCNQKTCYGAEELLVMGLVE